ncbi:hypothetical protein Ahy_B02g058621 [Arachis hypogaea]|uniref:Transposase MuDR plant domain-containing protein n=1 Tax=Arachis hypogaea TaxID=3818 RepID=A0A445AEZ5_ARAHY|nr:hypothetical protein Ahy_B02g058621 [Arachis hypogaea]
MKFNTKWEFKEAVREFTIQEGRRMRFRKNDRKRVRTVCKVKDCKWVVYASRDHEDSCWQVKTFFNNHTCPREDRNRAANRNWVAGIPCVHACAALARVNKRPEDFYHKFITMESYKKTYKYHTNPIPGQAFWEQSQYNRPLAPPIKRKPGNLQTKRRKDSDEGTSSSKKSKPVRGEPAIRPAKLPARRRSPPTTSSTALDPMKGASSATASRFTNFLKFVPTPGFKHPRKK